jgi:hypothetical protein
LLVALGIETSLAAETDLAFRWEGVDFESLAFLAEACLGFGDVALDAMRWNLGGGAGLFRRGGTWDPRRAAITFDGNR